MSPLLPAWKDKYTDFGGEERLLLTSYSLRHGWALGRLALQCIWRYDLVKMSVIFMGCGVHGYNSNYVVCRDICESLYVERWNLSPTLEWVLSDGRFAGVSGLARLYAEVFVAFLAMY